MKNIKYIIPLISVILLGSCKKDFLQRNPQTEITAEEFFKTPGDLETYSNGFYGMSGARYEDIFSDNISINTGSNDVDLLIRGQLSPETVGGWDKNTWGNLRRINFMLDNVGRATGDQAAINHYTGIARFFRGLFYFDMVKRYGDVPWYSHVLGTSDEDQLYKAKDLRTVVVDSIMSDLEFAAANVGTTYNGGTNTRVTKWAALTLLARFALYEGTYRKYHTELNLQATAEAFLQKAESASANIMANGGFAITGSGGTAYRSLFSSGSLAGNKEIIFLQKNDTKLGIANNSHTVLDWQWALSRNLADHFLMTDGTPFTSQANYDKKTFVQMFQDRDPRMAETIMPPGFASTPGGAPYVIKPDFGGLLQIKFYPRDPALRGGWVLNYTDLPIFRYAEVLLTNAEAKAELGTLTQADLDNTVNLLRGRVNMPVLNMATANAIIDPVIAAMYPAVSGANKGVILEIRRERRVEMACEGLRWNDLLRWKAGAVLSQASQGMYVPALGGLDVTGDGVNDIDILQNNSSDPNPGNGLMKNYLDGSSYYLSAGTSGFIMFKKDQTQPRNFLEKYYHFPIPLQQTVLNPGLKQPTGW